MEKLGTASFEIDEERVAWEGLASSCAAPIRRFAAFVLVGFTFFIAVTAAVILFYNIFGTRYIAGQGVTIPRTAFDVAWTLVARPQEGLEHTRTSSCWPCVPATSGYKRGSSKGASDASSDSTVVTDFPSDH